METNDGGLAILDGGWQDHRDPDCRQHDRRRYGRAVIAASNGDWPRNAIIETETAGSAPAVVRDVGLEGVCFETTGAPEVGTLVVLHVAIPSGPLALRCLVKHTHTAPAGDGSVRTVCGCCFLLVRPREAQALVRAAGDVPAMVRGGRRAADRTAAML